MNNETCNRCRLKYSLVKCENCKETFCTECDSYIHSISSKKDHLRKLIYTESTHNTISKLNLNYEPKQSNNILEHSQNSLFNTHKKRNNIEYPSTRYSENPYKNSNITMYEEFKNDDNIPKLNYRHTFNSFRDINDNYENIENIEQNLNDMNYINDNEINENNTKLKKNMSGFYINEIKNVYNNERNELILKINELSKELVDTKTNLGEHIDYLNNQIIDIENRHKEEISDLTLKYSDDLKINLIEKDTRIKELESELNKEKEKNEKLLQKLEEYEQTIKTKKNDIDKLSDEKTFIDNARKESEERFKQKISKMDMNHNEEMTNLKKTYEAELKKIKTELDMNKLDYLKMTEESKENINKIITERKKEKIIYNNEMNKLKEDITNKISENQKLNITIKDLKKNNQRLNEKVQKMNEEINYKEIEKKDMINEINKIQREKDEANRIKSKYHSVIYGRFKNRTKSKEKEYY